MTFKKEIKISQNLSDINMKFTISASELSKTIQKALPAIPPKSTLPVLEHFHLQAKDNSLNIVSTDQEISIIAKVDCTVIEDGEILVPARKFNEMVKALGKGEIEFSVNEENEQINITSSTGKYDMKGLSTDEYLNLPELFATDNVNIEELMNLESENSALLSNEDFNYLNDKTLFAVSKDEFRPAMTGVLFQFRGDELNVVATDSYRLVLANKKFDETKFSQEFDFIIPARTMELLKKVDEDVILTPVENNGKVTHIRISIGNVLVVSRLIDEKFPPFSAVIPKDNAFFAKIDKKQIIEAVKRVAVFTNVTSKQVKLKFEGTTLMITGEDADSGTQATEQISYSGNVDNLEIGFNYLYLEEAVQHTDVIEDNSVCMTFSEANRPALILPTQDAQNLLMLIMPVRLN